MLLIIADHSMHSIQLYKLYKEENVFIQVRLEFYKRPTE